MKGARTIAKLRSGKRAPLPSRRIAFFQGPRVSAHEEIRRLYRRWGYRIVIVGARELEEDRLSDYAAMHMPGGHSVVLSEKQIRNLKRFVRRGGGFLGICNGAHFAARVGLLKMKDMLIVRGKGIYDMRVVARHPVTRGLRRVPRSPEKKAVDPVPHSPVGRIRMDRGNGAFMVVGKNVDALLTYDNDDKYAGVAAGHHGKGRVVIFSSHPQADVKTTKHLKGTDTKKGRKLLRNAIDYVAGRRAD